MSIKHLKCIRTRYKSKVAQILTKLNTDCKVNPQKFINKTLGLKQKIDDLDDKIIQIMIKSRDLPTNR